jgi:hypothetical protein
MPLHIRSTDRTLRASIRRSNLRMPASVPRMPVFASEPSILLLNIGGSSLAIVPPAIRELGRSAE